ncbi:MAG: Asp-tRNA(Asn)/Glu-tRNA(Gln) amidotransferase subunit GatC [Pseudomonas sp.]|jgi:aspartyl-tRNA(Asn)/glutamyl-tRNA(Gln) amidotransferase subunit C|nr:Asp-tRNA(Asn)/Glu-tRNA(Gln) amidotransferase subunit GatC [Pseudomonas sp.]MDD2222406.1 Asp-tRNA(Asn)/Glu-tRNA(Gln) amidotransferase subunit GatC [Pseudomonas sp.]MDY0414485.1 Asp-tRNA(Asn)/Glu-tRNA(Gln) amidotransferase subunit GatC [Pseudomonas sp.]NLO54992.1 Asp-tRNA(Asn)/Glu-tRNA(Gln) amidotransferase subunit GatC [Gammaproteobacteria bacterium]
MALERCDVEKLAHLARLGLDDAQIGSSTTSLNAVLDMINAMQAVNTDGIAPLANPLEATQRLRPDSVTESNHRDDYQALAPAVENGLYLVPKVID